MHWVVESQKPVTVKRGGEPRVVVLSMDEYERREGLLSVSAVRLVLRAALSLPVRLFDEPDRYRRALDLAEGPRLPAAHDAHFLALAEWLGGGFWTADRRLANAVAGVLPWVHVLVCE